MSDKKLTILMLVTKRQFRGAEISAYNLSKALIDKGHQIIWVGLYSNKTDNVVSLDGAVNVDLPDSNVWLSLKKTRALISLYKKYKPDVCQANGSDTLRYLVAVKLLGHRIKIVYRNISIISTWINTRPKYVLFRSLFSYTDRIISVGEEALSDFRSFFPFPNSKSMVIRRGIPSISPNPAQVKAIKDLYSIADDDFVFIHIGHFSKEKNHSFLLEVWQQMASRHNKIKLVLLGDGALRESIIVEVNKRGISGSVIAPGLQTNIADWLAISKVMLLCSTVEGVPGVVVEASFQGVPTIAVNVGGVSEVLIDHENGCLVSSHDVVLFVENCEKILTENQLLLRLAANAKTLVRERFDLDRNTNQFIAAYSSIL